MSSDAENQEWLDAHVGELALGEVRVLPGDRFAGLSRMIFTTAIIVGEIGDAINIQDRWCYNGYDAAKIALDKWIVAGGNGEPSGWHRHPSSGRRISETGLEIDDQGRQVSGVGVMYVRR
jgi:hypothetical protein